MTEGAKNTDWRLMRVEGSETLPGNWKKKDLSAAFQRAMKTAAPCVFWGGFCLFMASCFGGVGLPLAATMHLPLADKLMHGIDSHLSADMDWAALQYVGGWASGIATGLGMMFGSDAMGREAKPGPFLT